jgi:hypothetical protein
LNIPEDFINIAKGNPIRNISLGYEDIYLFSIENIGKEQIGYSIDSNGNSLVTASEGSWKSVWLVVGFNENTGDPYFVDISSKEFPVYTSMHGAGSWHPTLISDAFTKFIEILQYLQVLSVGRENPVAFASNPISVEESRNLISKIVSKNGDSEIWYWENLMEQ